MPRGILMESTKLRPFMLEVLVCFEGSIPLVFCCFFRPLPIPTSIPFLGDSQIHSCLINKTYAFSIGCLFSGLKGGRPCQLPSLLQSTPQGAILPCSLNLSDILIYFFLGKHNSLFLLLVNLFPFLVS